MSAKVTDTPTRRTEHTYVGFQPVDSVIGATPRHPYPRLTPLLKELAETNRLESESTEVERFCKANPDNL